MHRVSRLCTALLLGAGLALGGCSTVVNPVTGKREWSTMSPERERSLGQQAAAQVEAQIGLVEDPALQAYVEQLGQRMARLSPRQDITYRFAVADMPEPNAFALPGGWIYVSRGLLAISNSEAEVANVLGHEIGHVAARHAAQRDTRATGVGLLTVLGTIAAGAAGGGEAAQSVAQLGQVAGAGYLAAYSRDQERQADQVGQGLAAAAGWDPAAMAEFLDTLDQETLRQLGEPRLPTFLDTHPVTAERVQATAARARTLGVTPAPPVARDRGDFFARLEGLLLGPDPAEGVFQQSRFLHPGLDFALEFPRGWETQNQKQAVGARSPSGDAVIVLEFQGPTADPRAAAEAFAQQSQIRLVEGRSGRIGGYDSYRARASAQSQAGPVGVDLTWIAHPAGTFRITGVSPEARFRSYAESFSDTALSFRPLRRAERDAIRERRLRVARARSGETLAALSSRTGNVWSSEQTAIANGLSRDVRLPSGLPVKIAVEVPYQPER